MSRRSYGDPNPAYAEGAEWLRRYIHENGLTQDKLAQVLGVNHARIWEWVNQQEPLPGEAQRNLIAWHGEGFPPFRFWL